ncbi:MAG TPA: DUF4411 family protein [Gaiellaceae bacterium]|nr:DUF4411 family protein [Gaiellaceae bacterium]
MFVSDTSAFLNGWRYHYPPTTFPRVWDLLEEALRDGRIIAPRAVYVELSEKDDDVAAWAKPHRSLFVDPSEAVQKRSGEILAMFPNPGIRNAGDPWVVAEAEIRGLAVVTYEGTTFSGVPTTRWHRSMPGICQKIGVNCTTLPEALGVLGGSF